VQIKDTTAEGIERPQTMRMFISRTHGGQGYIVSTLNL